MKKTYIVIVVLVVVFHIAVNSYRQRLSMDLSDPTYCTKLRSYLSTVVDVYRGRVVDRKCLFSICRYQLQTPVDGIITIYGKQVDTDDRSILLVDDVDRSYLYNEKVFTSHVKACGIDWYR